ncbi:ketopantoate reductase family protein [Nocardia coffeae]|uniref:ketopantoate reductase family protein n=1 Tax=Nocardia coffeae TaxID=2873381 RepID=UPI001F1B0B1E|nr:2-dehydropantoate 2-reductase [Nocardia coffeae]
MRITVFGAGGIGLYFAAMLARAGHRVTVAGRPYTVAAAANPLILERDSAQVEVPGIRAVADVAGDEGPADLVIVGVKAWQVPAAAAAVAPIVGPQTAVLPLQNGVEAAADLAAVLGAECVVGCSCVVIAQRVAPWAVRCLGADAAVEIGALTTESEDRVAKVAAVLAEAGIAVTRSVDIEATLWRKLMLIASYGGVGAIARQPVGVTRDEPETAGLVHAAMREVLVVARARGIALDEGDVARMMEVYRGFSPDTTSSMQRDLAAGRPSELDCQSGAVVRFGRAAGVRTPIHHTIYAAQLPAETAARAGRKS